MDVAFGSTNMPVSRKFIQQLLTAVFFLALLLFSPREAIALTESQPIHFSGDRQRWNRKANRVELFGHASVTQLGETLTGDYILLDLGTRILDSKGNCVYSASDSVIWGDEMHFNLDTRTGSVIRGRISNDRFSLRGERINKLGPGRFQAHWSSYTTCVDCSASWSLEAEDMDMQVEGYAFLSNVTTRIKDAPALWLPYMALPMKTRRQTGVLFPKTEFSGAYGPVLVIPFYWASSRNTDMTLGLGEYFAKGHRLEWEGRYVLSNGGTGTGKFFYINDRTFANQNNRWAMDLNLSQPLPWNISSKLRFVEASDNIYSGYYFKDLPSASNEAYLKSTLLFNRSGGDVNAYLAFWRFRNLLNSDPSGQKAQEIDFDGKTVQAYPTFGIAVNERALLGNWLYGGISAGVTNFSRSAGPFDYDNESVPFGTDPAANGQTPPAYRPGIDPIRKATRFSINPSIYTAFRPFDVFTVVPSFQYRQYLYEFGGAVPFLPRGYALFQTDISTQLQKIYDFDDEPQYPRIKHVIRPLLTYSLIPYKTDQAQATHPFVQQIVNAQKNLRTGYNFDDNDIVPYSYTANGAQYFVPLGHSLSYGFTSQWIRRKGEDGAATPTYQNVIEFEAGQAVNFLEMTNPGDPNSPHILNRFFSTLNFNFKKFVSSTTYNYNPDFLPHDRTSLSTSLSWIFERGMHQSIMNFERSVTLGYAYNPLSLTSSLSAALNFSISDYILPSFTVGYNFYAAIPEQRWTGFGLGVQFQNPSRCWKLVAGTGYSIVTGPTYSIDLQLNFTGGGFGGFADLANTLVTNVTGGP